ncbi:MAG: PEP-CTERM sorting domain-containing protein, partial [Phycisphaerales bacterium]
GETLGTTKANYIRELWARYYDPAWVSRAPTAQDNRAAQAFAAAIWEIIYEKMPTATADWDVTLDGTVGLGGFKAENLDYETANRWLHSLTGGGAKADLRVIVSNGNQEYLVAVPEPATAILLGLGGLLSVASRRRRRAAAQVA